MKNKEQDINQAVITLSNEIWEIQDKLEKAVVLLQEIREEYFLKYNNEKQKEEDRKFAILWEFPRYCTYAEMIDDYVFAAKKSIDKLTEIEINFYKQKSNETENNC